MKTVIEMAREIADPEKVDPWDEQCGCCVLTQAELERLAAAIRADAIADEREACANVCEQGLAIATSLSALDDMEMWGEKFATAIRARGSNK